MALIQSAPLLSLRRRLLGWADKLVPLAPLLVRITVGVVLATTGWGKLHNLDGVTEYFTSLKIPLPGVNAVFIASLEFVGGSLLVLGLLSRLIALLLIGTMAVAILTAKLGDVASVGDFLRLSEWMYLLVFVWIALAGPGRASLDHLLAGRLFGEDKPGA